MNYKLVFCSLLLATVFASGCANGPYTKITIVRHAEKQLNTADPDLTEEGMQRAIDLRDRHEGTPVSAVYSTNTNRTRQTAQPLADANNVPVTLYNTPAQVAAAVIDDHAGDYVAIVGHSNTVGDIILALGAELPDGFVNPIDEQDFDNFIFVLVNGDGGASAIHTTYGESSP